MDYTTKKQLNKTNTIVVYRYFNIVTKQYIGCWSRLSSMRTLFGPDKDQYVIHKITFKPELFEVVTK